MKIKNRLIITLSGINLIVFTIVTVSITLLSARRIEKSLYNQLDNTTEIVKNQVEGSINSTAEDYISVSGDLLLRAAKKSILTMDTKSAQNYIVELSKSTKIADTGYVYITDTKGVIIYHPLEKSGQRMSSGVLTNWVKSNKNESGITFNYRYKDRDKKLYKIYVDEWDWQIMVTVHTDEFKDLLNLNTLNNQMTSIKIGKSGYPIITDDLGKLLTHKSKDKIGVNITKLKDASGNYFLKDFLKKDSGSYHYNWLEPDGSVRAKYLNYIRDDSTGWYIIVSAYWDDFKGDITSIRRLLIFSSLLAMLINGIFIALTTNGIVKPINELTNVIQEISEGDGDLTRQISIDRNDETGHMANYLNKFVSRLNGMMLDIKKSTEHTISAKDDLSAVSEETSAAIYQITKNIDHIGSKIGHLDTNVTLSTDSVNEITGSISGLNNSIVSQNAMIEQSTAAITEMIASINSVAAITQKKQETVDNLVITAKEGGSVISQTQESVSNVKSQLHAINEMTDIISGIAERTNLLAMNAAIEAAHAGDAGKGFAVVADEIRKLAESSSTSSAKIQETIHAVSESITETSEFSIKTGDSFSSIDREIKDVVIALHEIIASTGELKTGGEELLSSINSLRDISSDVRQNSTSIKESADNVNQAMENTSKITFEVVTAIREVNQGTTEIQRSMGNVTENIQLISDTGVTLSENVNKFKIEV